MSELYLLTEHSPFMMGFVFLTDRNRAVIVDGGRPADMPYLFEIVGDRKIAAWIMTHPHFDHISGFNAIASDETKNRQIEAVYHHFPSVDFVRECEPYFCTEAEPCSRLDFEKASPLLGDRIRLAPIGETLTFDELSVEFLFCGGEAYKEPDSSLAVNEGSLVFRVTSPGQKSVLFLGDLGPTAGDDLLASVDHGRLSSDIVQMAHHGHMCVKKDVYEAIRPKACVWCAAHWLYNEPGGEVRPGSGLYGTMRTRQWMEELGVTTHYVAGDGTQKIPL